MTEQNALIWEGGQIVKVRPVPVPESRPGWVAVDIAYAGICGSDPHVAAGEHIRAQPARFSLALPSSSAPIVLGCTAWICSQ